MDSACPDYHPTMEWESDLIFGPWRWNRIQTKQEQLCVKNTPVCCVLFCFITSPPQKMIWVSSRFILIAQWEKVGDSHSHHMGSIPVVLFFGFSYLRWIKRRSLFCYHCWLFAVVKRALQRILTIVESQYRNPLLLSTVLRLQMRPVGSCDMVSS